MVKYLVPFRVSSRTNLLDCSRRFTPNSQFFIRLQPLFYPEPRRSRRQKSQLLWNQANPASFSKMPGWGGHPECFYGTPRGGVPRKSRPAESATYETRSSQCFCVSVANLVSDFSATFGYNSFARSSPKGEGQPDSLRAPRTFRRDHVRCIDG
jgi:hypothetical protein